MKNLLTRIEKLESHLKKSSDNQDTLRRSMILGPDEEVPYDQIFKEQGKNRRRIFIIPAFNNDGKIISY